MLWSSSNCIRPKSALLRIITVVMNTEKFYSDDLGPIARVNNDYENALQRTVFVQTNVGHRCQLLDPHNFSFKHFQNTDETRFDYTWVRPAHRGFTGCGYSYSRIIIFTDWLLPYTSGINYIMSSRISGFNAKKLNRLFKFMNDATSNIL